jgi:hypothetical protein
MLEKYTFMSKILFTQNCIHALWFKWFQAIYIYSYFSKLVHMPHIYIFYWSYTKIRWISIFWVVFEVFGIAKTVFTRHVWPMSQTYPASQTCPAPGPDRSESGVSNLYNRVELPLRTLGLLFLFHSISCGGQGLSGQFWVFSTESLRFLGDLTPLLLKIFKS